MAAINIATDGPGGLFWGTISGMTVHTCAETTGDCAMRKLLCVQVFIFSAYIREAIP